MNLFTLLSSSNTQRVLSLVSSKCTCVRGLKRWHRSLYLELHRRRRKQGPEPERHRSEWINWNYDSEVYAFGKRLGEDFKHDTLSTAFTQRSYLQQEQSVREELEMTVTGPLKENTIDIVDNTELAKRGNMLCVKYITSYLRHSLPALPEEGVSAICNYLLKDDTLAYIGSHLGIKDLILCAEFPPSTKTLSHTFMAVVGGLAQDQGDHRAHLFIQDFILTHLVGKDLMELWPIVNPMGMLQNIVTAQNKPHVESRLLYETGSNTILSAYMVGVYSDKQLFGKGYGETVTIAEEMAARDALKRLFGLRDQPSLSFSSKGHKLDIDFNKVNPSIHELTHPHQLQ